jgi:cystathionine beta-lyase/cystathionine gamma-synthase
VQTSTFHQKDVDASQEFDYARSGNPTRKALEDTIALLEGGERGYAFSSGMAAISSALSIFAAGDHIIVCEDVYGGTFRIANTLFSRFGLQVTFADMTDLENIETLVKPNTKALFLESQSNPLLKITDIRGAVALAKRHKLITILDNTFMSPYLQKPLELGVDIVVHSATKFLGGHSDVIAGLTVVKDAELAKRIYAVQNGYGAVLGPFDCWLLLRGIKTLKVRIDAQQKSAGILARWLSEHLKVERVYYPGLPDAKGRELHLSQAAGPGCVLSFQTKDLGSAKHFMKNVKLAATAVSLGGVETIVSYPVKMSHASVPKEQRDHLGITDRLIRVSVGLEDIDDLLADFKTALA